MSLNIYAYLLKLETGKYQYLHYGLFESVEEDILIAQQRSTELLLSELISPPCQILDCGLGLVTTAKILAEKGYAVTAIMPDFEQFKLAQKNTQDLVNLINISYEEFRGNENSFDVILFQESAQYIDSLTLLNKSFDLLKPNGLLMVIDEFSLTRNNPQFERLPCLKSFLNCAKRCGFELLKQKDLSEQVKPNFSYLIDLFNKYRNNILEEIDISQSQLKSLEKSVEENLNKYQTQIYGYQMLVLQKSQQPKWRIEFATPENKEEIRTLFKQVFEHEISSKFWNWKYLNNNGKNCIAWRDNQLVGHYGGIERKVLNRGKSDTVLQICDVMVLPSERKAKGPFFLTATNFLEKYVGFGNPYLIAYGFPNQRVYKLANILGLYEQVGEVKELYWDNISELKLNQLNTNIVGLNLELGQNFAENVNYLWSQMSQEFNNSIIGIRDFEYILQRYLKHPEKQYNISLIYEKNTFIDKIKNQLKSLWKKEVTVGGKINIPNHKILGLLVTIQQGNKLLLIDLIAPSQNIPLLIHKALLETQELGLPELFTWISKPYDKLFLCYSAKTRDIGVVIPTNKWTDAPIASSLQDSWWLMAGDTDFL